MKLVCIPAYNEESHIENIVKLAKNYVDSVIVCDDCSTDDTTNIAKKAGAKVILTTSSDQKGELVKEKLGIKHIVDYRNKDWPKQVLDITDGAGVDVVVEIAGGDTLARSIRACNYSARIGIIGILDDTYSKFKLFDVIVKQITLRGIFMESTEELNRLARFSEKNQLHPWIDKVFTLEKTVEAYKYLESQKHIGKVLIGL